MINYIQSVPLLMNIWSFLCVTTLFSQYTWDHMFPWTLRRGWAKSIFSLSSSRGYFFYFFPCVKNVCFIPSSNFFKPLFFFAPIVPVLFNLDFIFSMSSQIWALYFRDKGSFSWFISAVLKTQTFPTVVSLHPRKLPPYFMCCSQTGLLRFPQSNLWHLGIIWTF